METHHGAFRHFLVLLLCARSPSPSTPRSGLTFVPPHLLLFSRAVVPTQNIVYLLAGVLGFLHLMFVILGRCVQRHSVHTHRCCTALSLVDVRRGGRVPEHAFRARNLCVLVFVATLYLSVCKRMMRILLVAVEERLILHLSRRKPTSRRTSHGRARSPSYCPFLPAPLPPRRCSMAHISRHDKSLRLEQGCGSYFLRGLGCTYVYSTMQVLL